MIKKYLKSAFVAVIIAQLALGNSVFAQEVGNVFENEKKQAIIWMTENGYMKDVRENLLITRGEFEKIAWNIAGFEPKEGTKGLTRFKDVPVAGKYAPYVRKSLDNKIISFDEKNPLYKPKSPVSRIEALNFIYQTSGVGVTRVFRKEDLPFKDIKYNSTLAPLAKTAAEFGVFEDEERLQPNKKITEAEAAYLFYKIPGAIIRNAENTINSSTQNQTQIVYTIEPGTKNISPDVQKIIDGKKFPIFVDVWKKIHERFVSPEKIDDDQLMYGAINGMVKELGDPYTVFQEPNIAAQFNQGLSSQLEGIGVSIDLLDGKVIVVSPIRNSPAEKNGIQANDIITKVDDKKVEGMQLSDVAKLIKGPAGTNVSITIMRGKEEITKTIKREKIKIASVESSIKGNIGVISIYSFSNDTYKLFKAAATEMTNKNPKAIIIDLRSNPGGYLTTAMQIADYFLPKGTVISKLDFPNKASADKTYLEEQAMNPHRVARNNDTEIEYHSMGSGELSRHRVIILQNGGSASASEILAAAIRDNGKGTVIGENSFGKGSVQELIDYNDDSQFKMSIAKWLTPKGINLSKNPIVPDVIVKDDPKKDGDEVMNKALEMAQ